MAFDPAKAKHVAQLQFEGTWPTSVAFLGSGNRLAAANQKGELYIWDLPDEFTGEQPQDKKSDEPPFGPPPVRRLEGHTNGITQLLTAPDGKTLVSASLDHTIRLWDTSLPPSGKGEAILDADQREAEAKRTRNEEPLKRPGVEVEVQTACEVLAGHDNWIQTLDLSADGRRLISGDDDCRTIIWDLPARKQLKSWKGHAIDWVVSAALTADGKTAFVGEYTFKRDDFDRPPAQARIYNAETGDELVDVLKVQFPNVKIRDNSYGYAQTWGKFVGQGFVAADFSPDGKLLAVGQGGETDTGKVHLIETETGKLVRTIAGHQYGACDLMFSADGKYVLSCGRDTTVQICQVEDGKEVAKLHKPRGGQFKDWLYALALSPDEKSLAAADIAGRVQIWRFE
jgi:WD40 repeat protein